jgi:inhibitor of cysteine peptidase
MVLLPIVQTPSSDPDSAIPPVTPVMNEKIPVAAGIVSAISQLTTKEDVATFIRSHTELPQATVSYEYTPVVVSGNTRVFSFDVDTSTFKPDEYIVIASGVLQEDSGNALFNILAAPSGQMFANPTQTPQPRTTGKDGFYITINPISDKVVGDKFSITGTTNLPADAEMLIQVYSASFKPTQKSQSGEFSGATGTVKASILPHQSMPMPTVVPTVSVTRAPVVTAAPIPAPTVMGIPGRQYSRTNVQVREVDEGDIIKTDGENIYVVTSNCMHILKAYPAKDAEILSTMRFAGNPQALYIRGDRVVLIATDSWTRPITGCKPGACNGYSGSIQRTLLYVFSVKDPATPSLVREISIDGSYSSSRMIGTQIYFITSTQIPWLLDDMELPTIHDDHGGISTPPVYGFNTTDQAYAFSTIGSLDITGTSPVTAKSFLVGTAGTVYVSPTNLYIAVPDPGWSRGLPATTIHAFAIDNGRITYAAGGKVDGTLLTQYSLDEYNGNLRVATTISTNSWQMNAGSYSKITVLDNNLDVIGKLSGIAPGEQIYAARFMGERLYLVTFRQTDPFFVIGLADPQHPVILGELKIPGFSNYLHPYDASHIIGIGKESQSGPVKIALFDVGDVDSPVLIDSESLGGSYSTSPVLDDPRAFLFDKEKDILALPVQLQGEYNCPMNGPCPSPQVWGGVYVYGVSPKTGFVLKGKVMHYEGYYGDMSPVKRSLYIEDTLYTMSDRKIVMSDLAHSFNRINEVDFR